MQDRNSKKKKIEIKKLKNSNSNSERMKKSQLLIANITLSLDICYYAIIYGKMCYFAIINGGDNSQYYLRYPLPLDSPLVVSFLKTTAVTNSSSLSSLFNYTSNKVEKFGRWIYLEIEFGKCSKVEKFKFMKLKGEKIGQVIFTFKLKLFHSKKGASLTEKLAFLAKMSLKTKSF